MIQHLLMHRYCQHDDLREVGSAHQNALGPVIRCLVWNIFKARRSSWANDFATLQADRDLVLLQEAVLNAPSDRLFEQLDGMQWLMARSFRRKQSGVEHGIKTGSVAKSVNSCYYLSPHTEPLSQTQKLLLSTEYALETQLQRLLVLNMHAINFVGVRKYVDQLDQLRDALARHEGPVILAGDFNTWSAARLTHFLELATSAGLLEATMERSSRLMHMNRHLDHVFYRGLNLVSVECLAEYRSSDHAPIVATFEV